MQTGPTGSAGATEHWNSSEKEEAMEEPAFAYAQEHGRFAIRCTRLATALGNFGKNLKMQS